MRLDGLRAGPVFVFFQAERCANMLICGLQKLSLLDYPGKLAATVFTGGCNLRCPFCHNAALVTDVSACKRIPEEEVLAFLEKRRKMLDGVCITGGEPLLQNDLADFIQKVRALGYLVKLDTNGAFPALVRTLIARHLLDYVAMDIKNRPEKYAETVGLPDFSVAPVLETAKLLMEGRVEYEFRTTIVAEFHTPADILAIGHWLKGADKYFLQSFEDSGNLIQSGLRAVDKPTEMRMLESVRPFFKEVGLRGTEP